MALALLCAVPAGEAAAAPITHHVSLDTSSVSGTSGSLEFQFNPGGLGAVPATATITNFAGGTLLGGPVFTGDASGTLSPGPLRIGNATAFNDVVQDFLYGDSLSFDITLAELGPGAADPGATGSRFSLTLWDGPGATGSQLFAIDPSGAAVILEFTPAVVDPVSVPEPSTLALLGAALAGLAGYRRWRHGAPSASA
jgi:hypothetical protein